MKEQVKSDEKDEPDITEAERVVAIRDHLIGAAHSVAADLDLVDIGEEPEDLGDAAQLVGFCAGCLDAARSALSLGNELEAMEVIRAIPRQ